MSEITDLVRWAAKCDQPIAVEVNRHDPHDNPNHIPFPSVVIGVPIHAAHRGDRECAVIESVGHPWMAGGEVRGGDCGWVRVPLGRGIISVLGAS